MADRLLLVSSNVGVGNASSTSVYSLTPSADALQISHDIPNPFTLHVDGNIQGHTLVAETVQASTILHADPGVFSTTQSNVTLGNSVTIEANSDTLFVDTLNAQSVHSDSLVSANANLTDVFFETCIGGHEGRFQVTSDAVILGNSVSIGENSNILTANTIHASNALHTSRIDASSLYTGCLETLEAIVGSPGLLRATQEGNLVLGNSAYITTNSNTLFANTIVSNAVESNILTTTLVQSQNVVSDFIQIEDAKTFRVSSGNVVLGNTAYIETDSEEFSAQHLIGRSNVTTETLHSNVMYANGTHILEAIQNVISSSVRYYVKTTGDDDLDGRSWDKAFRTIKKAAGVAGSYSTIYVESGDYTEDNPIHLGRRVAVIGDNLRQCRLFPLNPKLHYFFVDDLCYINGVRFMDLQRPAFCVAFACCIAEATVQFQKVQSIQVLYSPTGYSIEAPEVLIEAPESPFGNAPTASASRNGREQIQSIVLDTNFLTGEPLSGDVYPGTTPRVTLGQPQSATGIQPAVRVSGLTGDTLSGFVIDDFGTRYESNVAPTVTIDPPSDPTGTRANAYASLVEGSLVSVILDEPGSKYASIPDITVQYPASIQATATAIVSFTGSLGTVTGFTITDPGSGYTSDPSVTIQPPAAIQATAVAIVENGVVDKIIITNKGSGYTNIFARPHISIPPPESKKAYITGSPYVQNSSSICGPYNREGAKVTNSSGIDPPILIPPVESELLASVDETGAGGGCLIDGFVCDDNSPLKSMVADSFTQVNQGGPGHLVINTGYAQFVSCFTTFCSYSYRCVAGGFTNVSTSVSDFGNYGLVSTGYWTKAICTAFLNQSYRSTVASVTINDNEQGVKQGGKYTSTPDVIFSARPGETQATGEAVMQVESLDNTTGVTYYKVDSVMIIDGGSYGNDDLEPPTVSFSGGGGSGAQASVNMQNPNFIRIRGSTGRKPDRGSVMQHMGIWHTVTGASFISEDNDGKATYDVSIFPGLFTANSGEVFKFYQGSIIATGQHVCEYVGSGVTYMALTRFGGQPNDGNQIKEIFPGRVFYCLTDQNGNLVIGKFFAVEQLTGEVTLSTDRFSLSGIESIGPFKRNGNPAGVKLEEVSNDTRLIDSLGQTGTTTVPTQFAVQKYVEKVGLKSGGLTGTAYVKVSDEDYEAYWIDVVLESEKDQPHGVPSLDEFVRIVGDGSIIQNMDASNLLLGTVSQSVLPQTLGNAATILQGNGYNIFDVNASNITQGTIVQSVLPQTLGNAATILYGNGYHVFDVNADNISQGTLSNEQLPSSIGTTATKFVGNGSRLTEIHAANITEGTVSPDRLLPPAYWPTNTWIQSTDANNRFYFASGSHTYTETTGNMYFRLDGSDKLVMTSDGHLGIGTITPTQSIDTTTNARIRGSLYVDTSLGVNTTTPGYTLDVNGTISGGAMYTNDSYRVLGDGGLYFENHEGGWTMQDTTWMRTYGSKGIWTDTGYIATNGRIGVGTSSPSQTIDCRGDMYITGTIDLNNSSPTIQLRNTDHKTAFIHNNLNQMYILQSSTNNATTWTQFNGQWPFIFYLDTNNALCGGELQAAGDVVAYASDSRLKNNIQIIPDALAKVQSLRGVTFEWKDTIKGLPMHGKDAGLVADDFYGMEDGDLFLKPAPFDHADGVSTSGQSYQTISYNKVHALMIQAIKELSDKVDRLEKLAAKNSVHPV